MSIDLLTVAVWLLLSLAWFSLAVIFFIMRKVLRAFMETTEKRVNELKGERHNER